MKYKVNFPTKTFIFTREKRENNMLYSHMKQSLLLWLHDKSHLLQQEI